MKKTLIVVTMVMLAAMLIVSCDNNKNTPSKAVSKIGDTVELGKTKDGKTITWEALDVKTDEKKALLISQDILENRVFSGSSGTCDYKDSDIRKYLTSTDSDGFINTYGLSTDYMLASVLSDVGDEKEDYVFLLSEAEVTLYLGQEADRVAKYNGTASDWWLRSHRDGRNEGATVGDNGVYYITPTNPYEKGLRPAFWYTWE